MAVISLTSSGVVPDSSASLANGTVKTGVTIVPGEVVALDSDGDLIKAVNDTATNAAAVGIAVSEASGGQPCRYVTAGELETAAATFDADALGMWYFVSSTAGDLEEYSDIANAEYATIVGRPVGAARFLVRIDASGEVKDSSP